MSRYTAEQCRIKISNLNREIERCKKDIVALVHLDSINTRTINNAAEGLAELAESKKDLDVGFRGVKSYGHKQTYKEIKEKADAIEHNLETLAGTIKIEYDDVQSEKAKCEKDLGYWESELEKALRDEEDDEENLTH